MENAECPDNCLDLQTLLAIGSLEAPEEVRVEAEQTVATRLAMTELAQA